MEFLQLSELQRQEEHIVKAFSALLATRPVVGRPQAKQWRFFLALFQNLFCRDYDRALDTLSANSAAQLKFEVEDKLRRYYQRPGESVPFVFSLEHISQLERYGVGDQYPNVAGYCLLVRQVAPDEIAKDPLRGKDHPQYIERVVTECIDAEFRAYQALPTVHTAELSKWFVPASPAYSEIVTILVRHSHKKWVISNPYNPSTKRLLDIRPWQRKSTEEQVVKTHEYWYLKWYEAITESYTYTYRETNRQQYILRLHAGEWKVYQNIHPSPRTSIPMRWSRIRIRSPGSRKIGKFSGV